ncbi:hypothetical protein KDW_48350 [Dictyobacter vulcani]|uniref:FAD/NAD(P)-binding domain-containing protein n=1 Tax=Dictyobacter vulcani TaxID=2607529 RepID=A0A5J4KSM3_9CHLR|nr:FAD-dependent oxidoreductase [Dictyobacter vulcani]GER90673.1 hypothetical protein KDW_48350 [Dictyobacter vulcani]
MQHHDTTRNVAVAMQKLACLSEVLDTRSDEVSVSASSVPDYAEQIAVIGAGPAGLSAAVHLVGLGYAVTLIEELPVLGGMMAVGIPDFRLSRIQLKNCLDALHHPRLTLQLNTRFGRDLPFSEIRQQYAAVLLAIGLQQSQLLNVSGERVLQGILPAMGVLRAYHLQQDTQLKADVTIIGGGMATVDVARVAIRAGASGVRVCYPGLLTDVADVSVARQEGVVFLEQVLPIGLLGSEDMAVYGMHCLRVHSFGRDSFGRHCLSRVPGSDFKIHTDTVVDAFGECADLSGCLLGDDLSGKTLIAYPDTLSTNIPGVFAAGDITGGYRSILTALEQGQRAANSIHHYLHQHAFSVFL